MEYIELLQAIGSHPERLTLSSKIKKRQSKLNKYCIYQELEIDI